MTVATLRNALPAMLAVAALCVQPLPARTVEAGPDDIIEVRSRVRFATAVVLPEGERILDWICGDADYWSVQGAANLAFVKPTAEGVQTNVTLVTDQGRVYTLLFVEDGQGDLPDLKLFLRPREGPGETQGRLDPVQFEPRGAAAALERQVDEARQEADQAVRQARESAERDAETFRAAYPATLRFDYEFDGRPGDMPFGVRAMWRDDRFTYISAHPEEVAALYESRDGKPSLVAYDFADGLYVTKRPIGDGWLQIGKRKLRFRRIDRKDGSRR